MEARHSSLETGEGQKQEVQTAADNLRLVVGEELLQIERLIQTFAQRIGEFRLGQRVIQRNGFVQRINDHPAIRTCREMPLNLGAQRL
jgi:hypothetical protein